MSKRKRCTKGTADNNRKELDEVRSLSIELVRLTKNLKAAGILPFSTHEGGDSSAPQPRNEVEDLRNATFDFFAACAEEPDELELDGDERIEAARVPVVLKEGAENGDKRYPDERWKRAMTLASALETKRRGFSFWEDFISHPEIASIGYTFEKIRESLREEEKNLINYPYSDELTASTPKKFRPLLKPQKENFSYRHISNFSQDVERCGVLVVLAWINKDLDFFSELAKKVAIAIGHRRNEVADDRQVKDVTIQERLIRVAIDLWYKKERDPSRDEVIQTLVEEGIQIRAKDQSGYFERCKLEFLKSDRKPGRPRKKANNSTLSVKVGKPQRDTNAICSHPTGDAELEPVSPWSNTSLSKLKPNWGAPKTDQPGA
jgi:hypothetical protein